MQFKLRKDIANGRYFVKLELTEFTESDREKSTKFGAPKLLIRMSDGSSGNVAVTSINRLLPFGFYDQDEASQYAESLKGQITELKKEWNQLQDSWSDEEIL